MAAEKSSELYCFSKTLFNLRLTVHYTSANTSVFLFIPDEMKDKEEKQGLFHFFGRMWKKMMRVSTEE